MSVVFTDVFVGDVSVFVDDEDGSRSESVAEEVEDVVADRDIVVFVRVQDREFGDGFCNDGFGTAEVVGADGEDFGTGV